MDSRVVNKGQLPELLDKLARDHTLVAPVREEETVTLFKKVSGASEVQLDYITSDVSPKGCIFPQTEKTISYTYTGDTLEMKEQDEPPKTVLFGCVHATLIVFWPWTCFRGKFLDTYYLEKRKNTVIIGLSCSTILSTCFCTAFNSGPCDGKEPT